MNSHLLALAAAVGLVALVLNLYWVRRVRTINRGLEAAREWDETPPEQSTIEESQGEERELLYDAADRADVDPEMVPEEVARLQTRLKERDDEIEHLRERWAGSWWQAFQRDSPADDPQVVTVELHEADSETAQSIAREALSRDDTIAIVTALGDGAFAIGVGKTIAEEYPATEVADQLVDNLGRGGFSGTERLVSGGGADGETIASTADAVADELDDEL
ncbi:hypothetical protein IL252_04520 [Halomicrobium sp. IBSBa]|uniref:hypothetical protein n=1 Tax=Halomicrobium sp. IBSBa TaxID=2778916 RepID=UPI001ABF0163|nr:hypothetical protein [Halomicrobium sp. IBSBa]MBO4247087.1 hypothetical protein [Halomicrobium sp. IBSBa]